MAVLARGVISLLNTVDEVVQPCGVQIGQVTYESFLEGLSEEVLEQAENEIISKPLKLLAEGLQADNRLKLMPRLAMIELQKRMLKTRAVIARTLKEQPEILNVSFTSRFATFISCIGCT